MARRLLVAGVVTLSVGFKDLSTVEDAPQGSSWSSVEQRAPILTSVGFTLSAVGRALARASEPTFLAPRLR